MELLTWEDKFSVGVKEVDDQHQKLISIINSLYVARKNNRPHDELERIFREVIYYTDYHFDEEEKMLKENDYSDFEDHRKKHLELTGEVNSFSDRLQAGDIDAYDDLLYFLGNWWSNHILVIDKSYGPHINSKGIF